MEKVTNLDWVYAIKCDNEVFQICKTKELANEWLETWKEKEPYNEWKLTQWILWDIEPLKD